MTRLVWVCLIWLGVSSIYANNLPSSFKKCNRKHSDFKQCLPKAVENAIGQLTKPFKEVGLIAIDPLLIPSMSISPGSGPSRFQQDYKNIKASGYSTAKILHFDWDFDKKTIYLEGLFPRLTFEFEYSFNGTLLVMPLNGHGLGVVAFDNIKYYFDFQLEEYTKHGNKYYRIIDSKLVLEPERMTTKLDNLFNGDQNLGNVLNQAFNDNWKEVFQDVKPSYDNVFGQILTKLFNNLLERVPISELFEG